MSISEELAKLGELHQRGVLTDEEFARSKARLLGEQKAPFEGTPAAPLVSGINALRRSNTDRWIAGVCGGLARATGMESWVWRLLFAILTFFGGFGLLVYLLLWVFVPAE